MPCWPARSIRIRSGPSLWYGRLRGSRVSVTRTARGSGAYTLAPRGNAARTAPAGSVAASATAPAAPAPRTNRRRSNGTFEPGDGLGEGSVISALHGRFRQPPAPPGHASKSTQPLVATAGRHYPERVGDAAAPARQRDRGGSALSVGSACEPF